MLDFSSKKAKVQIYPHHLRIYNYQIRVLIYLLACVSLLFYAGRTLNSPFWIGIVTLIIFVFFAVGFGFAFYLLQISKDQEPILTFKNDGLEDWASIMAVGPLKPKEIRSVQTAHFLVFDFLVIKIADKVESIENSPSNWRKRLFLNYIAFTYSNIIIPLGVLNIPDKTLYKVVAKFVRHLRVLSHERKQVRIEEALRKTDPEKYEEYLQKKHQVKEVVMTSKTGELRMGAASGQDTGETSVYYVEPIEKAESPVNEPSSDPVGGENDFNVIDIEGKRSEKYSDEESKIIDALEKGIHDKTGVIRLLFGLGEKTNASELVVDIDDDSLGNYQIKGQVIPSSKEEFENLEMSEKSVVIKQVESIRSYVQESKLDVMLIDFFYDDVRRLHKMYQSDEMEPIDGLDNPTVIEDTVEREAYGFQFNGSNYEFALTSDSKSQGFLVIQWNGKSVFELKAHMEIGQLTPKRLETFIHGPWEEQLRGLYFTIREAKRRLFMRDYGDEASSEPEIPENIEELKKKFGIE